MNDAPTVCVFIRAYNAEQYIEECLDSLKNQNYIGKIFVKILYDKGSTDNTQKKFDNILMNKGSLDIEIIEHEHKTPFRALLDNGFVRFANLYDYYAILDYDNLFGKNYISKAVNTINSMNSDCSFIYSNPIKIGMSGERLGPLLNDDSKPRCQKILKYQILRRNFIDASAIFMSKSCLNIIVSKLNRLSSKTFDWIFEDYSIGAIAIYYCRVTKLQSSELDQSVVYYRIHNTNLTFGNFTNDRNLTNINRILLTKSSFSLLIGEKMNFWQKLTYIIFFCIQILAKFLGLNARY